MVNAIFRVHLASTSFACVLVLPSAVVFAACQLHLHLRIHLAHPLFPFRLIFFFADWQHLMHCGPFVELVPEGVQLGDDQLPRPQLRLFVARSSRALSRSRRAVDLRKSVQGRCRKRRASLGGGFERKLLVSRTRGS